MLKPLKDYHVEEWLISPEHGQAIALFPSPVLNEQDQKTNDNVFQKYQGYLDLKGTPPDITQLDKISQQIKKLPPANIPSIEEKRIALNIGEEKNLTIETMYLTNFILLYARPIKLESHFFRHLVTHSPNFSLLLLLHLNFYLQLYFLKMEERCPPNPFDVVYGFYIQTLLTHKITDILTAKQNTLNETITQKDKAIQDLKDLESKCMQNLNSVLETNKVETQKVEDLQKKLEALEEKLKSEGKTEVVEPELTSVISSLGTLIVEKKITDKEAEDTKKEILQEIEKQTREDEAAQIKKKTEEEARLKKKTKEDEEAKLKKKTEEEELKKKTEEKETHQKDLVTSDETESFFNATARLSTYYLYIIFGKKAAYITIFDFRKNPPADSKKFFADFAEICGRSSTIKERDIKYEANQIEGIHKESDLTLYATVKKGNTTFDCVLAIVNYNFQFEGTQAKSSTFTDSEFESLRKDNKLGELVLLCNTPVLGKSKAEPPTGLKGLGSRFFYLLAEFFKKKLNKSGIIIEVGGSDLKSKNSLFSGVWGPRGFRQLMVTTGDGTPYRAEYNDKVINDNGYPLLAGINLEKLETLDAVKAYAKKLNLIS